MGVAQFSNQALASILLATDLIQTATAEIGPIFANTPKLCAPSNSAKLSLPEQRARAATYDQAYNITVNLRGSVRISCDVTFSVATSATFRVINLTGAVTYNDTAIRVVGTWYTVVTDVACNPGDHLVVECVNGAPYLFRNFVVSYDTFNSVDVVSNLS